MCGIAGFVGEKWNADFLGDALRRMEYRGYDSWGVTTLNGSNFIRGKQVGPISEACLAIDYSNFPGQAGIGHTRWATNGAPTATNAHPIIGGKDREVAVVHNGVIENHMELRAMLESQGYQFETETDTEVIAHLFAHLNAKSLHRERMRDLRGSMRSLTRLLRGQYAIAILTQKFPKHLLVACHGSPLLVSPAGLIASESVAFAGYTDLAYMLDDGQMAILDGTHMNVFDQEERNYIGTKSLLRVTVPVSPQESLGDFPHYMLKEIAEQPEVVENWKRRTFPNLANLAGNIFLFGCGSSYHAALLGRHYFEQLAGIPAQADYASELLLRPALPREDTLFLALTQSGETKDTVDAMKAIHAARADKTWPLIECVTNTPSSIATRYADSLQELLVGKEIGVAATKTFTAQTLALLRMAASVNRPGHNSSWKKEIHLWSYQLYHALKDVYDRREAIHDMADEVMNYDNVLFLGAGLNYPLALEAALKLKEVAYIHAEGMPAAEMKHGPIALITPDTLSIFLVTYRENLGRIQGNMAEIKARGGNVFAICDRESAKTVKEVADAYFVVPDVAEPLDPIALSIPIQLLAYYVAVRRGLNVDRPRSLAKTVTV